MALSEIEKLERRYAENPQGLTFAPLAEAHRKNGDVARALELLRSGLELHPDYIPASIVLGRCHWDLGNLSESESAFAHVLQLDGENVIALKALAEISERQSRFDDAERWLRQLLGVDRSNEEARVQLERIEAARQDTVPAADAAAESATGAVLAVAPVSEAPPAEPSQEPAAVPEPAPESEPSPALEAGAAEPVSFLPVEPSPAAETPEPAVEEVLALEDFEPTALRDEEIEPPPAGLEVEEQAVMEADVEPLAGLVGREVDRPEELEPEFRVETSEDIVLQSSGGSEFQMPNAAEELTSGIPQPSPFGEFPLEPPPLAPPLEPEPAPLEPAALEPAPSEPAPAMMLDATPETVPAEVRVLAEPEPMPALEPETTTERAAREPAPAPELAVQPEPPPPPPPAPVPAPAPVEVAEPEPVVTESMAEVLLQQGHAAEALQVYRELEARGPGDGRYRERIAELESAELQGAEPAAPPRKYTAAETGGRSVGDFLRGILSHRLPASGAPAPRAIGTTPEGTGAPTRPAADALSLSSVFGDEASPLPPAVPTAGAPPAGGVSYDEFFGQPGQGGGAAKSRGSDPKGDDLDQFHAWLQNLKR